MISTYLTLDLIKDLDLLTDNNEEPKDSNLKHNN